MNEKNLIPLNRRTEEERKAIARQGGKASGEARKEKASMKEIASQLLSLPKRKGKKIEFYQIKNLEDIDNTDLNIDLKTLIVLQQLKKASEGNLYSAQWIQNLIGEGFDQLEENEEKKEINQASDFIVAIRKRLDLIQIEGVDYEINEEGKKIPLKNGFPLPEATDQDFNEQEKDFLKREEEQLKGN